MRVLLDTNIILDVAFERQPHFEFSDQLLLLIEKSIIQGYVSASTVSDIYYIIRKVRERKWAVEFLNKLFTFCEIAQVDETAIRMALIADFKDLEDAIQYGVAIVNNLDAIITRNLNDFKINKPRILTPIMLIEELKFRT